MRKNIWIAIPTYWTHPSSALGEETVIFDHPTPLDENGTIERLFESLEKIDGNFKIVVVAAAAHESINDKVHSKVESLIKRFTSKFDIYLASPSNLGILRKYFPELELNLNSYGNIRNVQLLLPYLCGASLVVGIDDDEIITDKSYIDRVLDTFNADNNGDIIGGMAGPYYDKKGEYRIHGAENLKHESNIFIRKNYYMNEALKQYTAPGKIVKSNVAFGGNMAMTRATIACVSHDPFIARGEDYDYVINAAMKGIFYYYNPNAYIVHLPPDSDGSQAADKHTKLLSDIRRFIYMQKKFELFSKTPNYSIFPKEYLFPYPGPYVIPDENLVEAGIAALPKKYPEVFTIEKSRDIVMKAVADAEKAAAKYFEYTEKWERTLTSVEKKTAAFNLESFRLKP